LFESDLSSWNVGKVQNFNHFAYGASLFDSNLTDWNVESATSMQHMFRGSMISADLSAWNTSQVTSMSRMFAYTPHFNSAISNWDTSKVTCFAYMFWAASTAFNQDLSMWNVSSVVYTDDTNPGLKQMFMDASSFNQNLCYWGTQLDSSNDVTNMFDGSGCPDQGSPDLTLPAVNPLCYACL
jgi:surface protein